MILPLIGCNQIVDVSTDSIHATIKRRKEPSLTSGAFLQQSSKLEVWGKLKTLSIGGNECSDILGKDYFAEEVTPLFFEQCDYIITAKSLKGNVLHFDHADKSIRESVISSDDEEPDHLYGVINFGSQVGYSNLVFFDNQGNRLLVEIEVFPSKLSYKEDYESIRSDINEMVEAAAIDFINSTYDKGNINTIRNDVPAIFFSLINQLFDKFYKATSIITQKPNHKLVTEHNVVPVHKIRKTDNKTYQWIIKHPDQTKRVDGKIRVDSALSVQKRITYDTVENQLVKFMLSATAKKLCEFKRIYWAGFRNPEKSADPIILKRINMMTSKINRQLKNPVFEEVSELKGMNTMSLVFQMAPGYRDLYKYYQLIQRGISFSGEIYNFSMKETSTLYEYWCFVKLVDIMKKRFTLIDKNHEIIKANRKGVTVTLSKERKSVVKFLDTKTGDTFELIYNPGEYPSDTVKQVPDNVLSLKKRTNKEGKTAGYQYVFDAKYKVEMNTDEHYPDKHPGPKVADINTMHRYRDAIVAKDGNLSERLMVGAYVLFPYPYAEEEYKNHQFYRSIDSVNIGGLPFLPGKTQLAEDLLEKLVGESNESAFERTILPKGIEDRLAKVDWSSNDVLVGSLRSEEQWDVCYKDKYYYVPKNNMPPNSRQANYIAIYQSKKLYGKDAGIIYYGEVVRTEIVQRREINSLPSHASPNEKYYKFIIKEWLELDCKIEYESEWVYKPRYTNIFLLQNCKRTFELFNIKSEADYRLVSELRRIQTNIINVQDSPKDLFVKINDSISVYNDDGFIYVYVNGIELLRKPTKTFVKYPSSIFSEIQNVIESQPIYAKEKDIWE